MRLRYSTGSGSDLAPAKALSPRNPVAIAPFNVSCGVLINLQKCPKIAKNAAERRYKSSYYVCIFSIHSVALIFNCQYPHVIFFPPKSGLRRVLRRYSKWGAGNQNSRYIIRAVALRVSNNVQIANQLRSSRSTNNGIPSLKELGRF